MTNIRPVIIYLVFIFIFMSCKSEKDEEALIADDSFPDMVQQKYEHYIYKNQKKYLEATIEKANFFEKTNKVECFQIKAKIYDSKGNITTKIQSDLGEIKKDDKKFIFSENVVFELLEDKTKLYSEKIEMDYQNNKLMSDQDVLIEKEDGSYIKANAMESDIKLETTKFENMEIKYFYDDEDEENNN